MSSTDKQHNLAIVHTLPIDPTLSTLRQDYAIAVTRAEHAVRAEAEARAARVSAQWILSEGYTAVATRKRALGMCKNFECDGDALDDRYCEACEPPSGGDCA
jgi:hypothetical protein